MLHVGNILLFFVTCTGLGCLFTPFIRKLSWNNLFLVLGVGLAAIPVTGIVLQTLRIPLDVRVFLFLAVSGLALGFLRVRPDLKTKGARQPSAHIWFVLLIFLLQVLIYCGGAFRYPYLEDDDPWGHAAGIQYIALEKNVDVEPGTFHYINPYPPGYDIVLGLLHQTDPSLYWTMKFFNGLIVSLGFLFFYLFALEMTEDKTKAVLAAALLAATPCYLSHFIWAHALAVTLFFPAWTCLLRSRSDNRYILPGAVVTAGIFLTQPTQGLKFLILVLLMTTAFALTGLKNSRRMAAVLAAGIALSLLWWGPVLSEMKRGESRIALRHKSAVSGYAQETKQTALGLFAPDGGSATRAYTLSDYLWPPLRQGQQFNNPVGFGLGIILPALAGLSFLFFNLRTGPPQNRAYLLTLLAWLIFCFLGLNSETFHLPVGLFAFRFWMLLAIPVAFLAGEGLLGLYRFCPANPGRLLFIAVSAVVLIAFSGYPKVDVNTSFWPGGEYWSGTRELRGYYWLRKNIAPGTRVFSFSDNLLVIGHDMRCDFWTEEYKQDFSAAFDLSPAQLHARLKRHGFEYVVIGLRESGKFGKGALGEKMKQMENSRLFRAVYTLDKGVVIYRVA